MCRFLSVECECDDEQLQLRVRLQHVPIVKAGGRVGQEVKCETIIGGIMLVCSALDKLRGRYLFKIS